MTVLGLGLIGCGRIARLFHLNILTRLPDVELIALAESDPERRKEAGRLAPRAIAFADYRKLLEMPEIDAAVICLPPALHAESAIAAFGANKHVYLEKPIATNLKDARAVVEAWRSAGTVGMMGFNFRFNPLYQSMRRRVQSGILGNVISARSVFSVATRTLPPWKQTRNSGGGGSPGPRLTPY